MSTTRSTVTAFMVALLGFSFNAVAGDKVSPEQVSGAVTIDASKAKQLFDQGVAFVDVRKDKDWNAGRIPDAIHLELKSVYTADSLGKEVKKADRNFISTFTSKDIYKQADWQSMFDRLDASDEEKEDIKKALFQYLDNLAQKGKELF